MTSSPSRPTKKLKITKEKKTTSSSQPKKPNLSEYVMNSSNLQRLSCRPSHQFDFSNTIDDPIKVEEVEDPSKDNEQGLAYEVEDSSEDDSQNISSAFNETEMTEGSLDERAPPLEKASMSIPLGLPHLRFFLHLHLSPVYFFSFVLYFPFCRFHRD